MRYQSCAQFCLMKRKGFHVIFHLINLFSELVTMITDGVSLAKRIYVHIFIEKKKLDVKPYPQLIF